MRQLTDSERSAMQAPLCEYWVEATDGILPLERRVDFQAGFIAALDYSAAQIAALTAERDGLREAQFKAVKTLKRMVKGWRKHAAGDYCQTYNPERGKGLTSAADHLEDYINDTIQLAQENTNDE